LNAHKCKVRHLGNRNLNKPYVIEEGDTGLNRPLRRQFVRRIRAFTLDQM
jgi:hypothetical protein